MVLVVDPPQADHLGSRNNLLGKNSSPEQIRQFSNHLRVTKDTPPTFLIHANDDKAMPPENSILFYEALRKAGDQPAPPQFPPGLPAIRLLTQHRHQHQILHPLRNQRLAI
ncbi:MAG: hypothetical protein FJ263_06690 [Planctomycetes bacterium]|nr:hypothetical protein [Planctomycetota bacterium]